MLWESEMEIDQCNDKNININSEKESFLFYSLARYNTAAWTYLGNRHWN